MTEFRTRNLHFHKLAVVVLLVTVLVPVFGLTQDGIHLLAFKSSVLSDPLSVLENWNYYDETPCSWNGISCSGVSFSEPLNRSRVVGLALPNCHLLGSIPPEVGLLKHLQYLDLSNNSLNGSLPNTLFNISRLTTLSLANNLISGEIPEIFEELKSLQLLNLSDNAITGRIPQNLTTLPNLKVLSLSKNYIFGEIPNGFESLEVLDLSSNLFNGSLPENLGGNTLLHLNLSSNKLSGEISPEFTERIPGNSVIDLSFNNLTGEIPDSPLLKPESLSGNLDLCGKPVNNPCPIHSTISTSPNVSEISAPAIAAIPKFIPSSPDNTNKKQSKLRPEAIVGIIVGDLAGIGLLCTIFFYVYKSKKKNKKDRTKTGSGNEEELPWSCFRRKGEASSSDTEEGEEEEEEEEKVGTIEQRTQKGGSLIMVDGETELELETLLKASAYVLGATGSSIMYKAVLEDGTEFAVRRIGESGVERFRDFANQVRVIAKLRHPNLVRVRGYYWGADEKLIIYDFVPNGSLANACYKKAGSSPYQFPWEARLTIAKGVARALNYLHDKKHVHGNLKPTNILLGPNMEPKIGDFGLERLVWGENSSKSNGSARFFGSKRFTMPRDSPQPHDLSIGASPSFGSSHVSPYLAPEGLKILKPSPRWDVYSFGIILLELLTGKIFMETELTQWNSGFVVEEKNRVLRMADVGIRTDVEGREDVLMSCFRLGFSCASMVPQKRPTMKEIVQVLEKIQSI